MSIRPSSLSPDRGLAAGPSHHQPCRDPAEDRCGTKCIMRINNHNCIYATCYDDSFPVAISIVSSRCGPAIIVDGNAASHISGRPAVRKIVLLHAYKIPIIIIQVRGQLVYVHDFLVIMIEGTLPDSPPTAGATCRNLSQDDREFIKKVSTRTEIERFDPATDSVRIHSIRFRIR